MLFGRGIALLALLLGAGGACAAPDAGAAAARGPAVQAGVEPPQVATIAGRGATPAADATLLRIGTWDTMLQPWLPYEPDVIKVIARTVVDVLVLQSVWSDEAKNRILANPFVANRFKYSSYAAARQQPGSCAASVPVSTQQDYIRCLLDNGVDTTTVEQPVMPVPFACKVLGLDLQLTSASCFECIQNTMQTELPPGSSPLAAVDRCTDGTGVRYSHGGRPGQLILSRFPITDLQTVEFDTFLIPRVNIYATIGGVRFAFTHWPKNYLQEFDPIFEPLQTGALQPTLASDIVAHAPDIVMGDFNSGPDFQAEGSNLLLQNGYQPLYPSPTFCPLPSHAGFPQCVEYPTPRSIDNVYVKQNTARCRSKAFGQNPVSDHIGLAATCIVQAR